MQPRPDLIVLQRAEDEVQIGLDPRWSIQLNNLTPGQVTALLALTDGLPRDGAQLEELGFDLVRTLTTAGALLPGTFPKAQAQTRLHPDARSWAHLAQDSCSTDTFARRARTSVGVVGLGRTGLRIAQGLASAGVGRLVLADDAMVHPHDLGLGGYSLRNVGAQRRHSATQLVAESAVGSARLQTAPLREGDALSALDAVVVVGHGTVDPTTLWRLMAEGVPHLPIVWGEASASVGPLVLPGSTPCLQCVDLARSDTDPAWPLLVAQLAALSQSDFPEESMLAALAAALAVRHVLHVLDKRPPNRPGSMTHLSLPSAEVQSQVWEPHPECGCVLLAS